MSLKLKKIGHVLEIPDDAINDKPLGCDEVVVDVLEAPPKWILNSDVKGKLPRFRAKRKGVKHVCMQKEFVVEMQKVLKVFKPDDDHYDHEIVLFACQVAEDFFLDRNAGEIKMKCVIDACKPFFDDNEELVKKIADLVFRDVIKSTLWRRNQTRILNFFCSVLSR
jgi:hypothetical protein